MKFQKKITWLVCLFTPFKKLIKRKSGDLYNIIFQHIRKSIGCYPTHVIKIFIITWSKVTTSTPRTVNSAHVIYEIAVNCGKNVVNRGKLRGKSTNLEVVLFFRIRMCLLLCLSVAVSIFKCSISGFLECFQDNIDLSKLILVSELCLQLNYYLKLQSASREMEFERNFYDIQWIFLWDSISCDSDCRNTGR